MSRRDFETVKKEIEKEIEFQNGSMLTENLITTTENYIKEKFREKGYLKTKVTITTRKDTSQTNVQDASIVIDDELVTIGLDQLQFSDRQTLERRDTVRWGDPEQYGCYWYVD